MTVMCNPGAAAAGTELCKPSPAELPIALPTPIRIQAGDAPIILGDLHHGPCRAEIPAHTSRWPSPPPALQHLPILDGHGTMPAQTDPAAKPARARRRVRL